MFFFKKCHFIKILLTLTILSGCQTQEPIKSHGIIFLENRSKKLVVNQTNKNDVIKIIGYPQIEDDNDQNSWIYLERVLTKGKYFDLGKHKLKENNVLYLSFDKFGILQNKKIFSKNDMKKIKFSEKITENDLSKKSFIQSFLESVKQKMYSNRGKEF